MYLWMRYLHTTVAERSIKALKVQLPTIARFRLDSGTVADIVLNTWSYSREDYICND